MNGKWHDVTKKLHTYKPKDKFIRKTVAARLLICGELKTSGVE